MSPRRRRGRRSRRRAAAADPRDDAGRFREATGGRFQDSCAKCDRGRYNENSGSASKFDCKQCPAGRFANEPGMTQCKCMTHYNGEFFQHPNNTAVQYEDCMPQSHLDRVIRPLFTTIDYSPRTTYP